MPESHPIVPDAVDDASSTAVVPTAVAAADTEALERAAVAEDAADAAAASASATAEVADEAQQALITAERSADGVVSLGGRVSNTAAPTPRTHRSICGTPTCGEHAPQVCNAL